MYTPFEAEKMVAGYGQVSFCIYFQQQEKMRKKNTSKCPRWRFFVDAWGNWESCVSPLFGRES